MAQPRVRRWRSRPDVRAGDLDARRPAPPRPPLLPADARGHRGGDGPHPPLIYGYKPGDIGETFLTALADKVREGVEVRLAVDAIGSEVDFGSKDLYRRLREAGIEVVAHDGVVVLRGGPLGSRVFHAHGEDLLHFDHRKMAVFDGRVGYVGGSGIEDHYNDERFYDVMCRVEGPIVAQLQSVFLLSWRHHGGARPDDPSLARYFPSDVLRVADDAPLRAPTTVLWNVPGTGHHPISDAIERALDDAADQIHIVNPYISNRAILERLLAAALRGVRVRLVAPGKPTPPYPAAAFRHWYGRLLDAGVEILLHPEMAHAKVLRIDDEVFIGGCNLDDLSLFRNDELDLQFTGADVADLTERAIFDELHDDVHAGSRDIGVTGTGLERDDEPRLEVALGGEAPPVT